MLVCVDGARCAVRSADAGSADLASLCFVMHRRDKSEYTILQVCW
jgi:hypothetical protein